VPAVALPAPVLTHALSGESFASDG
jgi:hypothetical protein